MKTVTFNEGELSEAVTNSLDIFYHVTYSFNIMMDAQSGFFPLLLANMICSCVCSSMSAMACTSVMYRCSQSAECWSHLVILHGKHLWFLSGSAMHPVWTLITNSCGIQRWWPLTMSMQMWHTWMWRSISEAFDIGVRHGKVTGPIAFHLVWSGKRPCHLVV